MKQRIIATIFVFVLLSAACKMADPVIGYWKMGEAQPIYFFSDGTCSDGSSLSYATGGGLTAYWKRLDGSRLEIQSYTLHFGKANTTSTRIVTVKVDGNVLTMTEADGSVRRYTFSSSAR